MSKKQPRVPPTMNSRLTAAPAPLLALQPGEKALFLLPFPVGRATNLEVANVVARNAASLFGICPLCAGVSRSGGIDHREIGHPMVEHVGECPAGDENFQGPKELTTIPLVVEIADLRDKNGGSG